MWPPTDPFEQATSWLGGDGPPPAEGTLALIATSAQVEPLEGGEVLATIASTNRRRRTSRTRP